MQALYEFDAKLAQFNAWLVALGDELPEAKVKAMFEEVDSNGDGKIAFRAKLFDGKSYRGITRSNGHGTPGCCEVKEPSKKHPGPGPSLSRCPVVSWWSDEGNRSCWETVTHPSEPEGACDE